MNKPLTPDELIDIIREATEFEQVDDPMNLIIMAAEMMQWKIAVPNGDVEEDCPGLIMGTDEFLEDNIYEPEDFTVWASPDSNDENMDSEN